MNPISATVLVVDDDPSIIELMRDFLEADGFQVFSALEAKTARMLLAQHAIDCILLDVMLPNQDGVDAILPNQDGFDLCREIRASSEVPILFLSALDADMNKIRGLGLGGDDYIVKSATPAEVVARIKAVLRRYRSFQNAAPMLLDFGTLVIDVRAHEVRVEGKPVMLTAREYDLLLLLAEHPRQVFTAEQLLQQFWGEVGDRHTVTVHIGRIREKIESDPRNPQYLATVWGVGYRFEGVRR